VRQSNGSPWPAPPGPPLAAAITAPLLPTHALPLLTCHDTPLVGCWSRLRAVSRWAHTARLLPCATCTAVLVGGWHCCCSLPSSSCAAVRVGVHQPLQHTACRFDGFLLTPTCKGLRLFPEADLLLHALNYHPAAKAPPTSGRPAMPNRWTRERWKTSYTQQARIRELFRCAARPAFSPAGEDSYRRDTGVESWLWVKD
jgi:hypothetical protein